LVFDGKVFHPEEPVDLKPDTRVRATLERDEPAQAKERSFLETARSLRLNGPPDWSARLEEYLYGNGADAGK
jgi:hypothetical protein